jgi:hypothetical protein
MPTSEVLADADLGNLATTVHVPTNDSVEACAQHAPAGGRPVRAPRLTDAELEIPTVVESLLGRTGEARRLR